MLEELTNILNNSTRSELNGFWFSLIDSENNRYDQKSINKKLELIGLTYSPITIIKDDDDNGGYSAIFSLTRDNETKLFRIHGWNSSWSETYGMDKTSLCEVTACQVTVTKYRTSTFEFLRSLLKKYNVDNGTENHSYCFASDICGKYQKYDKNNPIIKELIKDGYSIRTEEGYGGENQGSEYWGVFSLTKCDTKEYFMFNGWYQSRYGAEVEPNSLIEVEPIQVMKREWKAV